MFGHYLRNSCRESSLRHLVAIGLVGAAAGDESDFFRTKVEPILTTRCFECHSHEGGKMKGGLTLDSPTGWAAGGDSGPAIIPGKPDESLLITAVRYEDEDYQMPPKKKLSGKEINVLEEWVAMGAPDPREVKLPEAIDSNWWSLRPLVTPRVPGTGHPIDAFIQRRLAAEGLKPGPQADRTTLARRLFVNLHGYLPTPEEVEDFVSDSDPNADLRLIDNLLSSPRYGERWARHWMDVIHFADSHGCEHDVKRPNAWRFRDYLISRLNDDVPWDRFIREQLAPDVFFPTEPQLMAGLGFIAAGPLELSRAGTAPVTFDYLDRDDIVTQTAASFISTTANCARCHTHKFDPVSQEDYYSLQAVFAGVGKGDIEFDSTAEVMHRRQEMNSLLLAASSNDRSILLQPKYGEIVEQWINDRKAHPARWTILEPETFVTTGGAILNREGDDSLFATGPVAPEETYLITSTVPLQQITAIRLDVLKDERLPKGGPGRAGNGNMHLSEVELQWFHPESSAPIKLKISRATADFNQDGWTSAHAIDGDIKTSWAIYPMVDRSHHLVLELESPVELKEGGRLTITLKQLPPTHPIGRFRLSVSNAEGAALKALPAEAERALATPNAERPETVSLVLAATALKDHARQELASLPPREVVYGASSSWSHAKKLPAPQKPKTVHLLRRGNLDQPVHEVGPGALSVIEALPGRFDLPASANESTRRAALADWLAHRDNPLTWRSIVNRIWHYHFGKGLVDTPNDFGRMGSQPTHPELLDWLAVWFRDEAKGSLKELHRLILTSATWKQASLAADTEFDPENRLLGRMNRQRMEAEVFRDSVLRVSGRLDLRMGGPGIEQFKKSPGPQSTPALDYTAFDWESPGATRRSVYRVVWRGIPDPFMESLDFPDLGLLAPKRGFSVSALQSLALFNNQFVLKASEWLGKRVASEHPELPDQIRRVVELVWLRPPNPPEQRAFESYSRSHGLCALCRVLLNSNEFLFVE